MLMTKIKVNVVTLRLRKMQLSLVCHLALTRGILQYKMLQYLSRVRVCIILAFFLITRGKCVAHSPTPMKEQGICGPYGPVYPLKPPRMALHEHYREGREGAHRVY